MPDLIPCQKSLFDIDESVTYFNCAYMGPLMRSAVLRGRDGMSRKSKPWTIQAPHFYEESDQARSRFARLIGAEAADISIVPAVSYGIGVAANLLRVGPDRKVMVLDEQFPSNVYPWVEAVKRDGGSVQHVPRPDDGNWTPAVLDAIDGKTAVVALPQCHWTDGTMVDLEAVSQSCVSQGIPLVLDLTQSLGAMPFDVNRIKPAFVVAACYKWLFGPYGLSFLYVNPQYQHGSPIEFNWITREGSENFAGLVDYTGRLRNDASRFDVGERSNPILLPMAIASLDQVLAWGVDRISETLREYNRELISEAQKMGFRVAAKEARSNHLVGLRYRDTLPAQLLSELADRGVYVSVRGTSIRVSAHLYNNAADLLRFLRALREVL